MSDVPTPPPRTVEADAVRAIGLAVAAVTALGVVAALIGQQPRVLAALLAAPLSVAVHCTLLTVPGLLVAQAWLGLNATPGDTMRATLAGVHDGAALLVATVPLVLFFGASMAMSRSVLILVFVAGEAALAVALARVWRDLVVVDSARAWPAAVVSAAWTTATFAVASLAAVDAVWTIGGVA